MAEVVTGGGKTIFALAAADAWLSTNPAGRLCILVPTTALQDQWYVALEDDFGATSDSISAWPSCRDVARPYHVMVINTARSAMKDLAAQSGVLMVIADECHRYASPENRRALVTAQATLGLSATAVREHDSWYEDILVPALGPTIYKYSLEQARSDGVIAPFHVVNIEVELAEDETERYVALGRRIAIALRNDQPDVAERLALQRATVVKRAAMRIPVAIATLDSNRGQRALVFHEDIESADTIAAIAAGRGHSVAAYHTGISAAVRRDNLRQFRNGWIDVLVSCRALDEGIDVPEAELAILAASTSSQRQRIQRLGRVLRPSSTKAAAQVVTIYATCAEQKRLLIEQASLTDVADVSWRRAAI